MVQVPASRKASAESSDRGGYDQKGSKQGNVTAGKGKQLKVVNGGAMTLHNLDTATDYFLLVNEYM